MQSRTIGSALVHTDTHDDRVLSAIGADVFGYDEDFLSCAVTSNAPAGWTSTLVGSSTAARTDAVGGALLLTTGATENDGLNMQVGSEVFLPSATAPLYFYARLQVSEATQSDLFVGLAVTDTDILGNLPKRIGFRSVDGSAALAFEFESTGNTVVEGVHTLEADTDVELEFFYDATNDVIRYYVDGVLLGSLTPGANLPDTEVKPSIQYLAGSAGAKTLTLDRVKVMQIGR